MDRQRIIDRYKEVSIATATVEEIVMLFLQEAIKYLDRASNAIESQNIYDKNIAMKKAQQLVLELMLFVNKESLAGQQLLSLYAYLNHNLVLANINADQLAISRVQESLSAMLESWKIYRKTAE